jgi:hypothetical protein
MTCGAKTRSGNACQKSPLIGRNRCRLHGGMSPKGADHWNWNYRNGQATKEVRQLASQMSAQIKLFKATLIQLGAIVPQKRRRK